MNTKGARTPMREGSGTQDPIPLPELHRRLAEDVAAVLRAHGAVDPRRGIEVVALTLCRHGAADDVGVRAEWVETEPDTRCRHHRHAELKVRHLRLVDRPA